MKLLSSMSVYTEFEENQKWRLCYVFSDAFSSDFRSLFARSDLAVTPREISSINTNK